MSVLIKTNTEDVYFITSQNQETGENSHPKNMNS